jgi:hypothetical protein
MHLHQQEFIRLEEKRKNKMRFLKRLKSKKPKLEYKEFKDEGYEFFKNLEKDFIPNEHHQTINLLQKIEHNGKEILLPLEIEIIEDKKLLKKDLDKVMESVSVLIGLSSVKINRQSDFSTTNGSIFSKTKPERIIKFIVRLKK